MGGMVEALKYIIEECDKIISECEETKAKCLRHLERLSGQMNLFEEVKE